MFLSAIAVFVITLIASIVVLILKRKVNEKYYYRFFSDRLEYRDTFFNKKKKIIKYEDFKEIRYNQGYMQSKFNLGELWILTRNKNFFKRIVIFKSIPNVEKEYKKITEIFNNQSER